MRKWIANIVIDSKDGISKGEEHDELKSVEEPMKVDTPKELQNKIINNNNQLNALEIATTEEEIPKEMQNKININSNHINASEFAGKEHKGVVIQDKSINSQIDDTL